MKAQIQRGIVVFSQKGRDKQRIFVVLYEVDADFVMICDGKTHPIEKMKKKRRKHLMSIGHDLPEIVALYQQNRLLNSDVRKALATVSDSLS